MTLVDPSPDGSTLRVSPDRLISAAGGLDALVEEFSTRRPEPVDSAIDAGSADLSAAVKQFVEVWDLGLHVLLHDQRTTAQGLRRAATEILGVDVDVAYAFQSAGLDPALR